MVAVSWQSLMPASGLRLLQDILECVDDVAFCRLSSHDFVRHRLVSDIVEAYARWDAETATSGRAGGRDGRDGRTASRGERRHRER